jgi:hypothetical protein
MKRSNAALRVPQCLSKLQHSGGDSRVSCSGTAWAGSIQISRLVLHYHFSLQLHFYPLRFCFIAHEPIHFPEGKSANILRGAFGTIFRRIACVPQCREASSCEIRDSCPYAQMFEPSAPAGSPSGLSDLPRPFVFRAWHLDGRTIAAGGEFHFDLNLFDVRNPAIAYLVLAFAQLAREGLGPRRSRVELVAVWQLGLDGLPVKRIFDGTVMGGSNFEPAQVDLAGVEAVQYLRLRFVTPTELKGGDGLVNRPEFGVVAARLRDRVSTLCQVYGEGPLEMDFRGFGERARGVRMTRCEVRHVAVERRSSRSGQVHSIGGFVGEAEYEGELGEFLPFLRVGRWVGVGRQTVWGKGEIAVGALGR